MVKLAMTALLKKLTKPVIFLTFVMCALWYSMLHVDTAALFQSRSSSSVHEIGREREAYDILPFPPNLPHGKVLRPVSEVLEQPWARDLYVFLQSMDSKLVTLVSANFEYTQQLLNWFINACVRTKMPCKNVLVLAFDQRLHAYLQNKRISSIHVNRSMFIIPTVTMEASSSYIYLIRFAVMRVINYWGFHVLSVDSDAIILKNLSKLFDKYGDEDIVGSVGHYPFDMNKKWGVTLCMGAVLFRATPHTELMWNVSATSVIQDDQITTNYVLNELGVEWREANILSEDYCVQGYSPLGLKVTILSNSVACRHCERMNLKNYYVWHPRAGKTFEAKQRQAVRGNLWLLDPQWNSSMAHNNKLTGLEWLHSLLHVSRED